MAKKTFYITSPIFYPNANLHMGHAYVMTVCDILARYHQLIGDEIYFLTGSDENTAKILKSSNIPDNDPSQLLELAAANFKQLYKDLGISYSDFIRTTDKERHWPGAQAMWKKLVEAGDVYKATYTGLYCIGCETFYTEKDLIDGKCPIHLTVPEKIEEQNYFFRLSKYTDQIKDLILHDKFKITPQSRKNEILALLDRGLEDVSFSRPIKNVPHGIPVPGDPEQVIYVWCDALVNYISALGFGTNNTQLFDKFWPANVHVIGKDILRFHAAIWPAMLLSAKLPTPKNLLVHGLITSGGHKMSKSLGNVIDPNQLIKEYGYESLRYFFAREISPFDDGDMTLDSFKNAYNANLANGLGNFFSRVMKMATTYGAIDANYESDESILSNQEIQKNYSNHFENFEFNKAAEYIWFRITHADKKIQESEPFKLIKTDKEKALTIVKELVQELWIISTLLLPFLPETAKKIKTSILEKKNPEPLFLRK